ncbi:hypothetical protein GIB67_039960 [Kingdonia uniflora]|uniref:RNase H type-1 domain-containing protein n=1 Tax=Kingdonia uniflora TaxID=39325 RepID=A0A7J7P3I1_9MAGN|nr:hypothetical protein GIB67_039960 [Kingdonia uniflora]
MGKFSVKGAFEAIQSKGQPVWWIQFLSNKAIHPQLAMWCWRLCHGKIPTDDKIKTKGVAHASRCCLCKNSSESLLHLIWECPFSVHLWNLMAELFLLRNLNRKLLSFLRAGKKISPYLKGLWTGAAWGGSYLIWKACNNCLYKDLNVSLANEKRKWINQIQDSTVLSTSLMHINQTDLGILHCLGVVVHSCKHPLLKSCFWELPRIREIKINTDGAAKGNPGKGGIGCIFCDCNSKVMGTLSKGLGLVTNFMAECEAIILGVEHAASLCWLIAWKESDSTTIVEAFKTNNIPWILEATSENARRNMRYIRFSANWREANFSADALSKKGALLQDGVRKSETGRPAFLKKIEVPMQEYFRFCRLCFVFSIISGLYMPFLDGRYRVGSSIVNAASNDQFKMAPGDVKVLEDEGTEMDVNHDPQASDREETSEILHFKAEYGIPEDIRLEEYHHEMMNQDVLLDALKEIGRTSIVKEKLYDIWEDYYGRIDNQVIDQEKVDTLFHETGLKKPCAKG